jgi:hypothetical protein
MKALLDLYERISEFSFFQVQKLVLPEDMSTKNLASSQLDFLQYSTSFFRFNKALHLKSHSF